MSAAAATGAVTIPITPAIPTDVFLTLLAAAPIAPAPLTALRIPSGTPAERCPTATAPLLALAAAAHPSLASLRLDGTLLPPRWLRAFTAALAPHLLQSLRSLQILTSPHPDGCAELAACLRNLPALTELTASMKLDSEAVPPCTSLGPFSRSAATLSPLPQLAHLCYIEISAAPRPSTLLLFLPLLRIPSLTTLEFRTDAASIYHSKFAAALSRLPALQTLQADHEMLDSQSRSTAPADGMLCTLRHVEITSTCPVSPAAMAVHVARLAAPSLTSLCLHASEHDNSAFAGRCTADEITCIWSPVPLVLQQCSMLWSCMLCRPCTWSVATGGLGSLP
eukprot:jgi/Ulvmu1/3447/UM016_0066.1